jgi:hypothetical protein
MKEKGEMTSGVAFIPKSASSAFTGERPEPVTERSQAFTRPTVITLCGSTRFMDKFEELNRILTLDGNVVFSVATKAHEGAGGISPRQKELLDRVHFEKIRLSDEIFVINVDGYVGPSTRREIEYAGRIGKRVRYLETSSVPR